MSLNKQKIIPLIESYYHTFTPLERTIADFFMNNTGTKRLAKALDFNNLMSISKECHAKEHH